MKQTFYLTPECIVCDCTISRTLMDGSGDAGSFINNEIGRDDFVD